MADATVGGLTAKDFYAEAGNIGLKVFGGYIVEEYEPQLRGRAGARIFREMADSDPTCGAIIFAISQAIRKIDWAWAPADQSPASLIAQEFFDGLFDDMDHTFEDFITEVLTMIVYGYAPFEIVLKLRQGEQTDRRFSSKYDDGMIGIRKLALRAQDTVLRWLMDADNNDIVGMMQLPWVGGIRTLPIDKMMLFRTTSIKNNPEGRSILRSAYRPYYYRKRMEEIEAVGIERDLAGLPVVKVPAELIAAANGTGPTAAQAKTTLDTYKTIVTNIRRNTQEGVVIPSDKDEKGNALFDLTLLSSGGRRNIDTTVIIDRYAQQIATTVMADFLLLGHSSRGSQGLASSKIEMFYSAIEGMVRGIKSTIQTQLVPVISELNGIPQKNRPTLSANQAEQIDLGSLGAYINSLAASGMPLFPDHDLEAYLRNIAGLPEASEETIKAQDEEHAQQQQQQQEAHSAAIAPEPMLGGGGPPKKPGGQGSGAAVGT
jgi:hypothetical protein